MNEGTIFASEEGSQPGLNLVQRVASKLPVFIFRLGILSALLLSVFAAAAAGIENLGAPVKVPLIMEAIAGIDEHSNSVIYFNCAQTGNKFFLLQVNPETDEVRQFNSPSGGIARGFVIGPDQCVYLGACEDGSLLKFDPARPQRGIENLGKPATSETYIWELVSARDGRIYGCTYPHAKLVRYDPKLGKSEDLGSLDTSEMYSRRIAESTNGLLYAGIGSVRAQVVQFDPKTGRTKTLVEESRRPHGFATLSTGLDGDVYAHMDGKDFRCDHDALVEVSSVPAMKPVTLADGAVLGASSVEGGDIVYDLKSRDGKTIKKRAHFDCTGVRVFAIGAGPKGRIYGSSVMPLGLFDFTPESHRSRFLGTVPGAEVYSFSSEDDLLYICWYPSSYLAVYDPAKPWDYGTTRNSNPRGLGYMGDGHLRPRAMIVGPDKRLYVGSLPPYGQVGGALGIYDPVQERVVENYRNIVTNQGISSLCYDPVTKQIFGGSSIGPGGGARAVAKECALFAFDPGQKKKTWEYTFAGNTEVIALVAACDKVYGIVQPGNTFFVLDPRKREIEFREKVPFAGVREISLAYYAPHRKLYGLAVHSIFSIDPQSHEMKAVAATASSVDCGFAVTDTGIYFGSGTQLMRYAW